jgi:23S rRNA (uridine2552-2'-O)-methyltransferase
MSSYEKPDFWSIKAQKEGYPARSVYKLQEIDEKFKVLRPNTKVLDLGAAPGSWSLWILKRLGASGSLLAVDLSPLTIGAQKRNFTFIQGDIFTEEIGKAIRGGGPYGLVVSDAAPLTTGNRMVDVARSHALVEEVILYAQETLAPGGNFVAKIFQGGDESLILRSMRSIFRTARSFKPKACRPESFETYLIGIGKLAEQKA